MATILIAEDERSINELIAANLRLVGHKPVQTFNGKEALRYIHYLKKDGVLIVNDTRIDPMPVVMGAAEYPKGILETIKKEHTVYVVDANNEARILGNPRCFNVIVLGMAARHMDYAYEDWISVIEETVPKKTIEINKKAFDRGYNL